MRSIHAAEGFWSVGIRYVVTVFNQPLNDWNVSKVTDMIGMFMDANSFNQPLNKWNVSNVIYMDVMFVEATSFNHALHAPWYVV